MLTLSSFFWSCWSKFIWFLGFSLSSSTMASSAATKSNSSIYTNHVNVHLSIDKLDRINYDTWASNIKLWLKSQSYVDYLTHNVVTIVGNEASQLLKLMLIYAWFSSLLFIYHWNIFRASETCLEVWEEAKLLYTNETYVFMVFVKIFSILLLPNILKVQWLNIWVKFMLFFTISKSYCLFPPLFLENSCKG